MEEKKSIEEELLIAIKETSKLVDGLIDQIKGLEDGRESEEE